MLDLNQVQAYVMAYVRLCSGIRSFILINKKVCLMEMNKADLTVCAKHGTNLTGVSPVTGFYRQV